jgi:AcrR family transcriptional regulator
MLEAARAVAHERGLAKACVAEVALRAGVGRSALYRHFGNKQALFGEALGAGVLVSEATTAWRTRQILETALRLFAERGFHETTTAAIAAELRVSEPVLYRYFEGKEAILEALIRERVAAVSLVGDVLDSDSSPGDGSSGQAGEADLETTLRAVAHRVMAAFADHPDVMRLVFVEGLKRGAAAGVAYRELFDPSELALRRFLQDMVEKGQVRSLDCAIVAPAFLGVFAFLMIVIRLLMPLAGEESHLDQECVVEEVVGVFLDGLRPRPSPSQERADEPGGTGRCGSNE